MIKFLPSYVGSKARWVNKLQQFKNSHIVELFGGSAVLSANLAKTAILNDIDPYIYKIFTNYNNLIVPEVFTQDDYFKYRKQSDWWRHAYCLQKMSFSGVFRYSKNGYNVPIKKNIQSVSLKKDYNKSKERFQELNPAVLNLDYQKVPLKLLLNKLIILDPPYEGSQASYNVKFDYKQYWQYIKKISCLTNNIIIFDTQQNITNNLHGAQYQTRKMRPNGKHQGNTECMVVINSINKNVFKFNEQNELGQMGEDIFYDIYKEYLKKRHGNGPDFQIIDGRLLELKTDFYNMDDTENFFIEKYSDFSKKTLGGPWQAQKRNANIFVYFFIKNATLFIFDVKQLVMNLNQITKNYKLYFIKNDGYYTAGYKVNRKMLKDIYKVRHV